MNITIIIEIDIKIIPKIIICLYFVFIFLCKYSLLEFNIVNSIAYVATVLQHTDLNTFHSNYHRVHHEKNVNCNYQQPFFTYWDRLFGTYVDPNLYFK